MTIHWKHFPAGEHGFFRAPVLLTDETEAFLVDGGFTFDDGRTVAAAIKATGKRLTTIFVSQSDPDYYFSLAPLHAAFPDARIIASEATVAAIRANVEKKIATWSPTLKANGPRSLAEVVIPTPTNERTFALGGEAIEVVDATGLANRRSIWVPSLRASFGGVLVFSGVHVWVADTQSPNERRAWVENLDRLASRVPSVVVAGHAADGAATDASALAYTRDYLVAFEQELGKAATSAALIDAMKGRYPNAGMGVALELGAKVATGEMKWG
jgi:glyoxylase-like metal-dependent hydrolase (beta-lactamase superfamily II)